MFPSIAGDPFGGGSMLVVASSSVMWTSWSVLGGSAIAVVAEVGGSDASGSVAFTVDFLLSLS